MLRMHAAARMLVYRALRAWVMPSMITPERGFRPSTSCVVLQQGLHQIGSFLASPLSTDQVAQPGCVRAHQHIRCAHI
jgi:hypothetical protein